MSTNGNGRTVPLWLFLALLGALGTLSGLLYRGVADKAERADERSLTNQTVIQSTFPEILRRLQRIEDKLEDR